MAGVSRIGKNIHMHVRIADVPEDHISPGEFTLQPLPIKPQHLAAARPGMA